MIQYVPTACNELVSQVVRTSAEVKKRGMASTRPFVGFVFVFVFILFFSISAVNF